MREGAEGEVIGFGACRNQGDEVANTTKAHKRRTALVAPGGGKVRDVECAAKRVRHYKESHDRCHYKESRSMASGLPCRTNFRMGRQMFALILQTAYCHIKSR